MIIERLYNVSNFLNRIPRSKTDYKNSLYTIVGFINSSMHSSIYISTRINVSVSDTYRGLVREGRAASSWTASGLTYLKLSSDQGAKPNRILSLKDLHTLLPTYDLPLPGPPTTKEKA